MTSDGNGYFIHEGEAILTFVADVTGGRVVVLQAHDTIWIAEDLLDAARDPDRERITGDLEIDGDLISFGTPGEGMGRLTYRLTGEEARDRYEWPSRAVVARRVMTDGGDAPWGPDWTPVEIDGEPRAEIRKVGRWEHSVRIIHGIVAVGPYPGGSWRVLGEKRARKFAAKVLCRYLDDEARRRQVPITIRLEDL